jgi:DNA replication protein DnaC
MTFDISKIHPIKRHWLSRRSNIPQRFLDRERQDIIDNIGSFPIEIDEWLDRLLAGDVIKAIGGLGTTGVGLLLDGGPGQGKTTHAVTTAIEFVRRIPEEDAAAQKLLGLGHSDYGHQSRPVYYMTFPDFISRKKAFMDADTDSRRNLQLEMDGFHGRAKEDHLNVRLLIIDDLGKEYASAYNNAAFDELLRSRYDKALPTIVTTNVVRDNWGKQYGDAMGSFAWEAFERVETPDIDRRKSA